MEVRKAMLSDDSKEHYQFVLQDMITRRSAHQRAIRELDPAIASISIMLRGESPEATGIQQAPQTPPTSASSFQALRVPSAPGGQRYATVSTRWAILDLLDRANGPMSASEIADALLSEGLPTRAEKFVNNVSAVLSDMKTPRGE